MLELRAFGRYNNNGGTLTLFPKVPKLTILNKANVNINLIPRLEANNYISSNKGKCLKFLENKNITGK